MKTVIFITLFSTLIGGLVPAFILMGLGEIIPGILTAVLAVSVAGILYFVLFKNMLRRERIRRMGTPATARVLQVKDTNVTVNNSPMVKLELEVRRQNGSTYMTTSRVIVSRLNPGMYRPGMEISVKIDPQDESFVVPAETSESFSPSRNASGSPELDAASARAMEELLRRTDDLRNELMVSGVDAEGLVLNCWELGVTVNEVGVGMEFLVAVKAPGKAPYNTEVKGIVHRDNVWKFAKGKKINLKIDPANPERVAIAGSQA